MQFDNDAMRETTLGKADLMSGSLVWSNGSCEPENVGSSNQRDAITMDFYLSYDSVEETGVGTSSSDDSPQVEQKNLA